VKSLRPRFGPVTSALSVLVGLLCVGAIALAITAQAGSPAPFLRAGLPPAKQAIINKMDAARAQSNPNPIPPDPSASQSIVVQPCTRDLSLLVSGLAPAHSALDFPGWNAYSFTNEWVDPSGTMAVQAGDLPGSGQGLVTVEQWSPPTSCSPASGVVYLAPTGSDTLTITGVSGSTVSLSSSAGTAWAFDLGADTFQLVS
jgi:hypothetical protein